MSTHAPAPSPHVRPAHVDDTAAIEQLLREADLPVDGVAAILATDAQQFVVATALGEPPTIVAVAGLEIADRSALLRSVAVKREWQHAGIGRELVHHIIDEARARRLEALYLLTTTAADYFPRFGFEIIARDAVPADLATTVEFTGACPASAIVMRRRVDDAAR